jgi:hypothetical protein
MKPSPPPGRVSARNPFEEHPTWVKLAVAIRERELTFTEIVTATAMTKGAIHRPLREMLDAGVAVSEGGGRGAKYWLHLDYQTALDDALAGRQATGELLSGQILLRVTMKRQIDLVQVLTRPDLMSSVAWAFELGGGGAEIVLVMAREASPADRGRVLAALEALGGECQTWQTGAVFSATELRATAASWKEASS